MPTNDIVLSTQAIINPGVPGTPSVSNHTGTQHQAGNMLMYTININYMRLAGSGTLGIFCIR